MYPRAAGPGRRLRHRQNAGLLDGTGAGLLIHDADARVTGIEYPDDSQLWTSPRPVIEGGGLHVYATRDELANGAPERVIPLDRAFAPDG